MAVKKTWGWMREKYSIAPAVDPDGEDLDFNARVNIAKDAIRRETGGDFAKIRARYDASCEAWEAAEEAKKRANLDYEACERLLMEKAKELGVQDGFKTEEFTYSVKLSPHPQVDDKERLRQWMVDQGMEKMLSLHWQTLKGMVAEALGPNGSRIIPDGVSVFVKESVSRLKRNHVKGSEQEPF